jgi:hypothetical protein
LNALIIGPWTKDLLEIAAHIKVANKDSWRHSNEKSDIDKAKKIRGGSSCGFSGYFALCIEHNRTNYRRGADLRL